MTEGLAIEIAQEIMRDMGLKRKQYMLRYRHLRLQADEKRVLKGENHLFILIRGAYGVQLKSKAGVYEITDTEITEMQHVHRGLTWITSTLSRNSDVYLLQVIPKIKNKK